MRFPVAIVLLILGGCLAPRSFDEDAWRRKVETMREQDLRAPHRGADGRFFNPWLPMESRSRDFWRWTLSRSSVRAPEESFPATPTVPNDGAYLDDAARPPSLTHVGHATFVVHWGGQAVVTDPFFGQRAVLPERLVPPAFGPDRIPGGSVVLISHNHYDHLDAKSIESLGPRCRFLCPLGLGAFLRKHGVADVRELDWWDTVEIDGTLFTCLPVQHWSRRFGMGFNETLWCAWLMERGGRKVFYGADSGYYKGFEVFGKLYPGIDAALLGVGAYEPRWFMHYAHMNIPETVQAFQELNARYLVPTQWGVLKLGDEPAMLPAVQLERAAAADPWLRERLRLLPVGGTLPLD